MAVLDVQNLTTELRRDTRWHKVVDDISFDVDRGETLAIVGESGSGKTVTALSIMQLLPKRSSRTSGRILFDGRDLLSKTEEEMCALRGNKIAMIFQDPMTSLNPVLTIKRQIAESLLRHLAMSRPAANAETVRLLERVRIPGAARRANDYPHQFSGGMLQRVMIAMALACRPTLLIADEPTTALDVTIQAQILELIAELQREDNMAVLLITHDMGVVAEFADRTLVMFRAKALEQGPTEDIFERPQHAYTQTLLAAVPRLDIYAKSTQPGVDADVAESLNAPEPVLVVKNLVTRFDVRSGLFGRVVGRVHAVENISFEIKAGEVLSLVGESGSGKSTTGRSILRLVEPQSGSVLLHGRDVLTMPRKTLMEQRKAMQMIFQDPSSALNPRMRVGDAIAEPMLAHGLVTRRDASSRVRELLSQVGLSAEMAGRFPHEFSGGQRQRIVIARVLGLRPEFVVADEAVSALDVSIKAQIIDLLIELQREHRLAYLFVSHDIAAVERISDRVAVMYLGEIVEIGPKASVLGSPQHPYTKRLLAAVPIADPTRRHQRQRVVAEDIRSPVRPADYEPPPRHLIEYSPGHFVQAFDSGAEYRKRAASPL